MASGRPQHTDIFPHLGGSRPVSSYFGSQGRDLKLCVWDLAEGRNAIVDSVLLESMGFCRGSVLAGGLQRWMLAVPGRGSDEVSEPIHPGLLAAGMLCPEQLLRPALAWSPEVALVLGVGKGARSGPRSLGGLAPSQEQHGMDEVRARGCQGPWEQAGMEGSPRQTP